MRGPALLLSGAEHLMEPVADALGSLQVELVQVAWGPRLVNALDSSVAGVVIASDLTARELGAALRTFAEQGLDHGVPVMCVVPDGTTDAEERSLYRDGAAAVFEWPCEAASFPLLLSEVLGLEWTHGRATDLDKKLSRVIVAHLRHEDASFSGVRPKLRDGIASLSGMVERLLDQEELVELVAAVPGVRSVEVRGIMVKNSGMSDQTIKRNALAVLRRTADADLSTITMAVERGYLTLAGAVDRRRDLQRMIDVLVRVRGVRGIDNNVVVSTEQRWRDHQLAERLERRIRDSYAPDGIEVSVFDGVAVLRGEVSSLRDKRAIERLAATQRGVRRAASKLEVRPG